MKFRVFQLSLSASSLPQSLTAVVVTEEKKKNPPSLSNNRDFYAHNVTSINNVIFTKGATSNSNLVYSVPVFASLTLEYIT